MLMNYCFAWISILGFIGFAGCTQSTPTTTQSGRQSKSIDQVIQTEPTLVQENVREITGALFAHDANSILKFTHPYVIEDMGGRGAALAVLEASFENYKDGVLAFESLEFPSPPVFVQSQDNFFVLVPTITIMVAKGQRVASTGYQFGVRAKGNANWKYIDGLTITRVTPQGLFPDFPTGVDLPETSQNNL